VAEFATKKQNTAKSGEKRATWK